MRARKSKTENCGGEKRSVVFFAFVFAVCPNDHNRTHGTICSVFADCHVPKHISIGLLVNIVLHRVRKCCSCLKFLFGELPFQFAHVCRSKPLQIWDKKGESSTIFSIRLSWSSTYIFIYFETFLQ